MPYGRLKTVGTVPLPLIVIYQLMWRFDLSAREQKGLQIAATVNLWKASGAWQVPSQSSRGRYTVNHNGTCQHCTCPNHESRGVKCKQLWAVGYTMRREVSFGSVTETAEQGNTTGDTATETVTKTVKVTYKQNWPATSHPCGKHGEGLHD